ncbi:unnamed protein product [Staurois parvus]|uniref:Uncharacterized protein n=1 Tax=Staurois parvus TaxID=386267 RepID=A0ABN9D0Y9_9NEOB|nr:unnamed protein product [Staurois parvus]
MLKKNGVGSLFQSTPNPYPSMQPGRSGKGGGRLSTPPNHTRPHALNMGGCFGAGGLPPKHLVPMLMGTRASSPQPWPVVVGV